MTEIKYATTAKSTIDRERLAKRVEAIWLVGLTILSLAVGLTVLRSGSITNSLHGPDPAILAWLLYLLGVAAIIYQPRYGVYLLIFLTLVGDSTLLPWYPFAKNLSSSESLLYLHDSLIFSPLETYLVLTLLSWLIRGAMQRNLRVNTGAPFASVMIFAGFMLFGLFYGLGTGGDLNAGLWEARPIFYLPVMLLLASNLIETRAHVNHLLWAIILALSIEGIAGTCYFFFTLNMDLGQLEAITEHSAAVHMNTLFVLAIAVWFYKASASMRYGLLLMLPFVMLTYLATQRRAAFLAMFVALGLIAWMLYRENRRAFWLIVPPLLILGLAYLAAFWNNSGALGQPARAIKSVLTTEDANSRDTLSNSYRVLENINILYTIHISPLLGVGFGHKFYIAVDMPDISFFAWWEYITHNSILWIWMKMGLGGFLALLFMIGMAISTGVRALWRMPGGELSAAALMATLYLVMHFLYAYVDMSWDNQSMVYVGTMMGLISVLEPTAKRSAPLLPKRWPWQPEPQPAPGLCPLSAEEQVQ